MTKTTSSLADELEAAASEQTKGPSCGVKIAIEQLSEQDALALEAFLRGNKLHATTIASKLEARNIKLPVDALRRHRRMLRNEGAGCECRPIKTS